MFEIDPVCSADVDRFILFVSLRSQIIISLDEDDESVDAFVGFKIFIKPLRKFFSDNDFHKRWIPRINVLGRIEANWSENQNS